MKKLFLKGMLFLATSFVMVSCTSDYDYVAQKYTSTLQENVLMTYLYEQTNNNSIYLSHTDIEHQPLIFTAGKAWLKNC